MLGQAHELNCSALGAEKLNSIVNYKWTKMNDTGTFTEVGTNSNTLSLSPLYLSHAGSYTCEVNITSQDFLTGSTIKENNAKLEIPSKLINFTVF